MKMRGLVMGAVVLMGAGVVWGEGGKLPFMVSKETTGIVEPLKADGSPDYLGAMNAEHSKGVTVENNGFVVWVKVVGGKSLANPVMSRKILAMCGAVDADPGEQIFESYGDWYSRKGFEVVKNPLDEIAWASTHQWKGTDYPRLADYLKEEEGVLSRGSDAARKEKWWMPYMSRDGELQVLLSRGIPGEREFGNHLCARAMLRAGGGDRSGCLTDLITVKRLAHHMGNSAWLVERISGIALDTKANEDIGRVAAAGILTQKECDVLEGELKGLEPMPTVEEAVDTCERWSLLNLIETWSMQQVNIFQAGSSIDRPFQSVEWGEVDWDLVLRVVNGTFDEYLADMKMKSLAEAQVQFDSFDKRMVLAQKAREARNGGMLWKDKGESKEAYSRRITAAFLGVLFPEMGNAEDRQRCGTMEDEMVKVLVVAAGERARTGVWPKEMANLPRDIYGEGDARVRYVVGNGGVQVYSVGVNGKDDGGIMNRGQKLDDVVVGVGG